MMSLYYQDDRATIHYGDCLEVMADMPAESVDSIVCDPPYGLGFMGREWDHMPPGREWAEACLRVLKPGGHLLAFGGSRTWHRLAVAIEDGGFEIRDSIAWLYGAGFPKSHDVSKAIDRMAGAERKVTGRTVTPFKVDSAAERGTALEGSVNGDFSKQTEGGYRYTEHTTPATPEAQQWEGWGTALKPAFEPIIVARKPFPGTVAENVLEHGTGAINVDGCRVGIDPAERNLIDNRSGAAPPERNGIYHTAMGYRPEGERFTSHQQGRWPANVALDESQADALDEQSGYQKDGFHVGRNRSANEDMGGYSGAWRKDARDGGYGSGGGASRFFYTAKAPASERPHVNGVAHPTVKPLSIMRWLLRLVTPPGGTTLDPFAGSGTTIEAAIQEHFKPIGIEITDEYLPLIKQRIERNTQAAFDFTAL